jgi:hypothetical protein
MEHQKLVDSWNNLKPFESWYYIPPIPIVNEDTYNNVIIPNLIRCGAIPKYKLEVGKEYSGRCRNTNVATWNGKQFEYTRYKFGTSFIETINHFEDDNGSDLFVPLHEYLHL